MLLTVHKEPVHIPSKFLMFNKDIDLFRAESTEVEGVPDISYLRIELVRLRAGMSDFIIRLATPKVSNQVKSNTLVTLRANKAHGTAKGVKDIADTIASEMQKRGDSTHTWEKLDIQHLTKMLIPYMKFFVANTALENMQFTTEALM